MLATFLLLVAAGCGDSANDFVFTGNNVSQVGLRVSPETRTLSPGTTQQFLAEVLYSNGSTQVVTDSVTWTSSDTNVATISAAGLLTAVAPGNATVQASLNGFTDTAAVQVTEVTVTGLSVTPTTPSVVVGQTQQLVANATFSNQTIDDVTDVSSWTSSDETIATVDQNGLVTAVAIGGPVTISANFGGQTATAQVTVTAVPLDPPVATSLNFVTTPAAATAGAVIAPSVQVEVLDQYGDRFDTNATLTLFFGNNPTGATLTGSAAAAVNGLATFDALSIDKPGVGYTLVATGAGVNPVSTAPFNVNLPADQFNLFSASLALPAQANPDQGGNSSARWTATGDFNNDGRLDAVTVVGSANLVRVHLRQADGRFVPVDFTVADASAVVAGDLDNDGNTDFLVVRRAANLKSVFLGNGDGSFDAPTDSTAPTGSNDVELVNATGDALPDLVIASENPDQLNLFENNGTATVFGNTADEVVTLTADGEAVAAGNLDGANDGLDVVVGLGSGANDIAIYYDYDPTTDTFGSNTAIAAQGTVRSVALGNVNGATGLDIIVGSSTGIDSLLNDGNATPAFTSNFRANNLFPAPNMSVPAHPQALTAANLDADAADEVVVADVAGTVQNVRIFLDITDAMELPLLYNVPHNPLSVVVGDFNGDGNADVSVLNRSTQSPSYLSSTSTLAILVGDGNDRFGPVRLGVDVDGDSATETRVNDTPAIGDVNGDTFPDLVVASSVADEIQIWLGDGTGGYPFAPDIAVDTIVGNAVDEFETNPLSVALRDLDGDNDLDLVLADSVAGEAGGRFFLNNGADPPVFTVDDANALAIDQPQQVLTAQLDGDADLELVWRTGTTITVANGTYPYTGGEVFSFGAAGANDLAAGFINGDAFADLVGSTGSGIVVFFNDTAGGFEPPVLRNGPGAPPANINRVASGDLDGDGLWDVAASQANSNQIHLFFSQGETFEDLSITASGSEGPQGMAIGDLNGDGLNDLVVAGRYGSNVGIFLGRGSRFLQNVGALLSGIVSHVAVADLNGDGRADVVAGSSTGPGGLFPLVQQAAP